MSIRVSATKWSHQRSLNGCLLQMKYIKNKTQGIRWQIYFSHFVQAASVLPSNFQKHSYVAEPIAFRETWISSIYNSKLKPSQTLHGHFKNFKESPTAHTAVTKAQDHLHGSKVVIHTSRNPTALLKSCRSVTWYLEDFWGRHKSLRYQFLSSWKPQNIYFSVLWLLRQWSYISQGSVRHTGAKLCQRPQKKLFFFFFLHFWFNIEPSNSYRIDTKIKMKSPDR